MRISDWSSDVCSSDLHTFIRAAAPLYSSSRARSIQAACSCTPMRCVSRSAEGSSFAFSTSGNSARAVRAVASRSEEHTSELQSLMRISYAVFCLKKKKNKKQTIHNKQHQTSHCK